MFRSPYGSLNEELLGALDRIGNVAIGWNVDSLDWKELGTEVTINNVLGSVKPGSIILMHDGGNWTMDLSGTVQALDTIITRLKDDGYEFVTVPQLLNIQETKE